jgi:menaquinone reductase, molybdopterin-binding-like subunit
MPVSRRDLLLGLGGGIAGLAVTPVPWKLLDDVAIRTQHRRALPIPARGELVVRPAVCPLCPAGCALRVRCYGARPVSTVGEPLHPLGRGGCALGLTLHHLAFHPLRLLAPARRTGVGLEPIALSAAVAAMAGSVAAARKAGQSVLVLDRRPGRVVSGAWDALLAALPNGVVATPPTEGDTLEAVAAPAELAVGVDLARTRTLLSFGTPVLDGWGHPGRLRALRKGLRVVQLDSWRSASAALADEWLSITPGAEGPLAMALAHVVVRLDPTRASAPVRAALAGFEPASLAAGLGLPPDRIEALARSLLDARPAIAIGGGDAGSGPLGRDAERAIALLNQVLGSVGVAGGLVPRRVLPETPRPADTRRARLADLPAGSVRLAILDAADDGRALPWPALARTLAADALVVSLSPFDHDLSRHAQLLVPGAAPLESYEEALPTADAASASYGLSAPLLPKPEGATDAVALTGLLAQALGLTLAPHLPSGQTETGTLEERLRRRVAAIHAAGRGRWRARGTTGDAEAQPADPEAAWRMLLEGGCWIDAPLDPAAGGLGPPPLPSPAALARWRQGRRAESGLALVACGDRGTVGAIPVSPLLTKIYQESELRPSLATASVHPRTAEAFGLREGRRVRVASAAGATFATLRCDPLLPEGRLALPAGPAPLALHAAAETAALVSPPRVVDADGVWRGTRVELGEA